jgi:hypothetical protein
MDNLLAWMGWGFYREEMKLLQLSLSDHSVGSEPPTCTGIKHISLMED